MVCTSEFEAILPHVVISSNLLSFQVVDEDIFGMAVIESGRAEPSTN